MKNVHDEESEKSRHFDPADPAFVDAVMMLNSNPSNFMTNINYRNNYFTERALAYFDPTTNEWLVLSSESKI